MIRGGDETIHKYNSEHQGKWSGREYISGYKAEIYRGSRVVKLQNGAIPPFVKRSYSNNAGDNLKNIGLGVILDNLWKAVLK